VPGSRRDTLPPAQAAKNVRRKGTASRTDWRRTAVGSITGMATEAASVILYLIGLAVVSLVVAHL